MYKKGLQHQKLLHHRHSQINTVVREVAGWFMVTKKSYQPPQDSPPLSLSHRHTSIQSFFAIVVSSVIFTTSSYICIPTYSSPLLSPVLLSFIIFTYSNILLAKSMAVFFSFTYNNPIANTNNIPLLLLPQQQQLLHTHTHTYAPLSTTPPRKER